VKSDIVYDQNDAVENVERGGEKEGEEDYGEESFESGDDDRVQEGASRVEGQGDGHASHNGYEMSDDDRKRGLLPAPTTRSSVDAKRVMFHDVRVVDGESNVPDEIATEACINRGRRVIPTEQAYIRGMNMNSCTLREGVGFIGAPKSIFIQSICSKKSYFVFSS